MAGKKTPHPGQAERNASGAHRVEEARRPGVVAQEQPVPQHDDRRQVREPPEERPARQQVHGRVLEVVAPRAARRVPTETT